MEIAVQRWFVQEALELTGALELDDECISDMPHYSIIPLP